MGEHDDSACAPKSFLFNGLAGLTLRHFRLTFIVKGLTFFVNRG